MSLLSRLLSPSLSAENRVMVPQTEIRNKVVLSRFVVMPGERKKSVSVDYILDASHTAIRRDIHSSGINVMILGRVATVLAVDHPQPHAYGSRLESIPMNCFGRAMEATDTDSARQPPLTSPGTASDRTSRLISWTGHPREFDRYLAPSTTGLFKETTGLIESGFSGSDESLLSAEERLRYIC